MSDRGETARRISGAGGLRGHEDGCAGTCPPGGAGQAKKTGSASKASLTWSVTRVTATDNQCAMTLIHGADGHAGFTAEGNQDRNNDDLRRRR